MDKLPLLSARVPKEIMTQPSIGLLLPIAPPRRSKGTRRNTGLLPPPYGPGWRTHAYQSLSSWWHSKASNVMLPPNRCDLQTWTNAHARCLNITESWAVFECRRLPLHSNMPGGLRSGHITRSANIHTERIARSTSKLSERNCGPVCTVETIRQ